MPDSNLADNGVLTSTFYNTYIRQQVIVTCTSATRPTGVEGRVIYETDTDLLRIYNGTTWQPYVGPFSGWATYTPTISQGASTNITKTTTYSKYTYVGAQTITWNFRFTLTAAGTAGSGATLTVPLTATSNSVIGVGAIYDASTTTTYSGMWTPASTTTIQLIGDWSSNSVWGGTPNLALASSDQFYGSVTFEVA